MPEGRAFSGRTPRRYYGHRIHLELVNITSKNVTIAVPKGIKSHCQPVNTIAPGPLGSASHIAVTVTTAASIATTAAKIVNPRHVPTAFKPAQ